MSAKNIEENQYMKEYSVLPVMFYPLITSEYDTILILLSNYSLYADTIVKLY